jgi:hypothetical protein
MILSLLLALSNPEPKLLLTCEQYEWLVERTMSSPILSIWEKIEFVARYAEGTDPTCFPEVKE